MPRRRPDASSDDDKDNTERSSLSAPARPSDDKKDNNQASFTGDGTPKKGKPLLSDSQAKRQDIKQKLTAKQDDGNYVFEPGLNMNNSFASMAAMSTAPAPIAGTTFTGKTNRNSSGSTRVAPGAVTVPMKGDGCVDNSNEVADDNEDEYSPTTTVATASAKYSRDPTNNLESTTTIVAEAVVREDDVEAQVEHRFRERADELAESILARLRPAVVVDAQRVENITAENVDGLLDEATRAQLKRKRLFRIAGCVAAVIVSIIVIVVVVVLVTQKPSSPSPTVPPTSAPSVLLSLPPSTIVPATAPPSFTAANVPELQSNTSATLLQLVDGASNHTLLAQYLNYSFNSDLLDILSTQHITLFAPSDASFRTLQYPPYQYYFTGSIRWALHLYVLLATHIVTQNLTKSQVFIETTSIPTVIKSSQLAVNNINMTIENGASIVDADIQALNGYIQVPDRVLLVSRLRETMQFEIMSTSGYVFSDEITKFRTLLDQSGLQDILARTDFPFGLTFYLPNDSAFDSLDDNVTMRLFSSPTSNFTREFIMYHFVARNLFTFSNPYESIYFMLNSVSAWMTANNPQNQTFINSAKVLNTFLVQNGVLHIIDQVLVPPNVGELLQISTDYTLGFNFTTFVSIVNGPAELSNLLKGEVEGHPNLGKFTDPSFLMVFAPLERAFSNDIVSQMLDRWLLLQPTSWLLHLQSFVRHHFSVDLFPQSIGENVLTMLSGFNATVNIISVGDSLVASNKTINGVQVNLIPGTVGSDMLPEEGLIFVIDEVLLPPWVDISIYSMLTADTDLSTFVSLVDSSSFYANLLNRTDNGPWTLLAPTNDAFVALLGSDQTISSLINNATFARGVLGRHIISSNVYSPILSTTVSSITNHTHNVTITEGNNTLVGGARIVSANNLASNGVIHVIDQVLLL